VRNVDLELHAGDVIALFGRNGAGKTTLLRALADLVTPSRGTISTASIASAPSIRSSNPRPKPPTPGKKISAKSLSGNIRCRFCPEMKRQICVAFGLIRPGG